MSTLEPPAPGRAERGPEIDPRIRARRIEVRRDAGRRRLQRLVDAGLVLTVAALFVGALWTPLLDVDTVTVTGVENLDAAAVATHAGVEVGDPLISVDVGAVGERVAALPWVSEVAVERGVDGSLTLAITERVPVATVGSGSSAVLVDVEGRVLAPAAQATADPSFVTLTGAGSVPAPGRYLPASAAPALALAAHLGEAIPGAIASVDVEDLAGTLTQGGVVSFGDATQLDAKVRSLRTVLAQVDLTCLAQIDLQLPDNAVLTREDGCS